MPTFTVLCRVDAFVDYAAEVEADSAAEAAECANGSHNEYTWVKQGEQEFDAALYVTLNAEGDEIEGTQCGDF